MRRIIVYSTLFLLVLCTKSVGVFAQEPGYSIVIEDSPDDLRLAVASSTLVINKLSWKMSLYGEDKKLRMVEAAAPSFFIGGESVFLKKIIKTERLDDSSVRLIISLSNNDKGIVKISSSNEFDFRIQIESDNPKVTTIKGVFSLQPVEEIYGFGEMWNGHVAQRGQSFDLWDKSGTPDECAYMPYFVSTNNYGFFLNYGGQVSFDVGQSNSSELVFEAPVPKFDFTLLTGNSLANTVQNYVKITGMPACPPRWAFKPWFWLMSAQDKPGANINTLKGEDFPLMVKKLKELNFPVGVTWFEPPWQDARNSFIPNKDFSADLKGLIKEVEDLGVKMLAWTVPYTTPEASNWDEAVEKGYLVQKPGGEKVDVQVKVTSTGEVEGNYYTAIDYYNPEAFEWWKKQIEASVDLGLKGFKPDAGQDIPKDALLYGNRLGKDVRNSYALEYNKVYFKALKDKLGDDFLMVPRAAWIGSAAYTNFKWPGDLSSDFGSNGLPSSVYSSISLALSGIPFVSSDIGGFMDRPAPEDIWVRWAQFGTFIPGMQTLNMPWYYSESALKHYRYLTWLHTDLIPFWMSLAHDAHQSGTPLIRPLVWDYQNDVKCWRVDDEFTVGNAFLIAPIINSNADREVYLPEGTWIDFWNEKETLQGPKKIRWFKGWKDSKYKFPVYIREGSIIPMEISNEESGFGSVASKGYVTLSIWPKVEGESTFALNDTEAEVLIKVERSEQNKINISWGKTSKNYLLRVHLRKGETPAVVKSVKNTNMTNEYNSLESFRNDTKEGWYFDAATQNLWVRKINGGNEGAIDIALR